MSTLKNLVEKIQDDFYQYCRDNIEQVATASQDQVPVDTGHLKRSMETSYTRTSDGGNMSIEYKADYAAKVHFNLDNVIFKNGKSYYLMDPMVEMVETKLIKD